MKTLNVGMVFFLFTGALCFFVSEARTAAETVNTTGNSPIDSSPDTGNAPVDASTPATPTASTGFDTLPTSNAGLSTTGTGMGASIGQDTRIQSNVMEALSSEAVLHSQQVSADVQNGVIRLNGVVSSIEEKNRAGDIASSTSGALRVQNNITVSANARVNSSVLRS